MVWLIRVATKIPGLLKLVGWGGRSLRAVSVLRAGAVARVAASPVGRAAKWTAASAPGRFTRWLFNLKGNSWRWLAGGGAVTGTVAGAGYSAWKGESLGTIFKTGAVGSLLGALGGALLAFVLSPWGLISTGAAASYLFGEEETPPPAVAPEEPGLELDGAYDALPAEEQPAPDDVLVPSAEPAPAPATTRKLPALPEEADEEAPAVSATRVAVAQPRTLGLIGGLRGAGR